MFKVCQNFKIWCNFKPSLSGKNFLSSNSSLNFMHMLKRCYTENAAVCVNYTNFYTVV